MSNNKIIGIVLLAVGAVLLYFGINATDAPTEQLSEAVTGRYSDTTMIYMVGGGVAALAGIVMLLKK
jgi:myosin-crossreactive antigen